MGPGVAISRARLTAKTGRRAAPLFDSDRLTFSDDCKRVIGVDHRNRPFIYDYAERKVLWHLRRKDLGRHLHFDRNDAHVRVFYMAGDRVQVAKWDAGDGRVIADIPEDGVVPLEGLESGDGRFLATHQMRTPHYAPQVIRSLATGAGISWNGQIGDSRDINVVSLAESGERIGVVSPGVLIDADSAGQRFAVKVPARLSIYTFPPQRNWFWIIVWPLGPPVVLWFLRAVWRWRRCGRESRPGAVRSKAPLSVAG